MKNEMNSNQLRKHILDNDLERVAVELVDVNVPKLKYQAPKVLPKRMIINEVYEAYENSHTINYVALPNYERHHIEVPTDFIFVLLDDDIANDMFAVQDARKNELEKEFRAAYDAHHSKIAALVAEAQDKLYAAVALSDQTGVPFRPDDLCGVSMSYIPDSFASKFGSSEVVDNLVSELTGAHHGGEYTGWQTSQTC